MKFGKESKGANKEARGKLLDEAERRTKLHRKYLIRILSQAAEERPRKRKLRCRARKYGAALLSLLVKVWEIFDYACGQRPEPASKQEVQRLREFGELRCSDELAGQLEAISAKTIDRLLAREKRVLQISHAYRRDVAGGESAGVAASAEHIQLFASYYPAPMRLEDTIAAAGLAGLENRVM